MKDRISKIFTERTGWAVSVLFHLLLSLFFLNIMIEKPEETSDYANLTLSNYVPDDTENILQRIASPAASQARQRSGMQRPTRTVDIPTRRMTERDDNKIPMDTKGKVQSQENARRLDNKVNPTQGISRRTERTEQNTLQGMERLRGSSTSNVGEKITTELPTEGIGGSLKAEKPYEISWEGGDREIIADVIPKYPEGIYKEVLIRIKISVLPNGTVGDMIPLQKGDATLESLTMKALKQWRFNPLETGAPQVDQSAIVSFRFVLK